MDSSQNQSKLLTSVLFCPGKYTALYERHSPYDQLDGVLELLDLADSYVLNDVLAIGGVTRHGRAYASAGNEIRDFLLAESKLNTSVEIVTGHQLDPYRKPLGIEKLEEEINSFDKLVDEQIECEEDPHEQAELARDFGIKRTAMFEEINVREAQAYILLADSLNGTYVPERMFGNKALERYPDIIKHSPHFAQEQFLDGLRKRLSIIHAREGSKKVFTPSFLLEALRASQTQTGITSALRDLRYSSSAENYRSLTRMMIDESRPLDQREKAFRELEKQATSALSHDKLEPRIPRVFKFTLALTAFAVSFLFPPAAVTPLLIQAGEAIDAWVRNRNNIFQFYPLGSHEDLYVELKRLFPAVKFGSDHLAHFLQNRNFGWSDEFDMIKFLYPTEK